MSVPLTPSADKNWITAHWACSEESMARSLTVISLLLQSTTHCRYRVYNKYLLTYTAIYRGNRKVLPLGITALQPQSHFHLGTPYNSFDSPSREAIRTDLRHLDQYFSTFPAYPQDHEECMASVHDMYNGIWSAYLQRIQWSVHTCCEHCN